MSSRILLVLGLFCWGCSQGGNGSSGAPAGTGVGGSTGGTPGTTGSGGSPPATMPTVTMPSGEAGGNASGGSSSGGAAVGAAVGGALGASGSSGSSAQAGGGKSSAGGASAAGGTQSTAQAGTSSVGDGDSMVGPTYMKSVDLTAHGAAVGKSFHFVMNSVDSKIFKGDDATLLAANQHSFTRGVDVYVPAKYKDGSVAPFIVIQDGPGQLANIKLALDNLTQGTDPTRRLPTFIAIAAANGGGDSIGSERGLEYDTVSDRYAQFVQTELLPAVLANAAIKAAYPNLALTSDPNGRATIGCSSGAAAAFTMGWFHPEWFGRIVTYSGTFVAQQNPAAAEHVMYPSGAWDYHSDLDLVGMMAAKPLRVFINANQNDNGSTAPESGKHNWLLANQHMATAFKAQNYHYRFVEGLGAGHCQGSVQDLTLADTLLWVWQGYPLD